MGDTSTQQKEMLISTLQYMVCVNQCESYEICKHKNEGPKLTPLTLYICRYISQINEYSNIEYPYSGNWQKQPQWVLIAFNIALNERNRMINLKYQKNKKT